MAQRAAVGNVRNVVDRDIALRPLYCTEVSPIDPAFIRLAAFRIAIF
jgi:hypothetical protein